MRLVGLIAAAWMVGAFLTVVFVAGATRLAPYREPKREEDDSLDDVLAGSAEALADVYGEPASHSASSSDRLPEGILERRVVRAPRPGRAPLH